MDAVGHCPPLPGVSTAGCVPVEDANDSESCATASWSTAVASAPRGGGHFPVNAQAIASGRSVWVRLVGETVHISVRTGRTVAHGSSRGTAST